MSALLHIERLEAFYGPLRVLHGIDLEVGEGDVVALLGANGAGKTTLLRAVSGLIRRRGRVTFASQDITLWPAHRIARAGIAHVPEGRGTFVELTVEENLRLGAITRRQDGAQERLERVLGYFPRLRERWHQLVADYAERYGIFDDWGMFAYTNGAHKPWADYLVEIDVGIWEQALDDRTWAAWVNLKREIAEVSLAHGGSITACHGATRAGDAELVPREMGSAWEVVKAIKRTLDPNNIMNPGKQMLDQAYEVVPHR
jgi:ABC-type sugar transport system ATPase subunit